MVHIYSGILVSHTKEYLDPVLMRWMNIEPIIQNGGSVRKRNIIIVH